jgi:hypothetical protein|tara:strand:+ start:328 stop:567 length:240 start_codon:yes stop_codon:yes gene_type:complete
MTIEEKAKLDLRFKKTRPDQCILSLQNELYKLGGSGTKAFKCWEEMLVYINYLEAKLKRKDANFKNMKETIRKLKEMTE